jgi:hypothetical protein
VRITALRALYFRRQHHRGLNLVLVVPQLRDGHGGLGVHQHRRFGAAQHRPFAAGFAGRNFAPTAAAFGRTPQAAAIVQVVQRD